MLERDKFVIVGLPRSGTTLLVRKLDSHPEIECENELFNPYEIVKTKAADIIKSRIEIDKRDSNAVEYIKKFYSYQKTPRVSGFNYMLGHNVDVFEYIHRSPEIKIIFLYRENKLAQISSWQIALQSGVWAVGAVGKKKLNYSFLKKNVIKKIEFNTGEFNQLMHEFLWKENIYRFFLRNVPNKIFEIGYSELFTKNFDADICDFLEVDHRILESGLQKQNDNKIINRFSNPDDVVSYLKLIKKEYWCEREI